MSIVNALAITRGLDVVREIRFSDGRRGLLDVYAPKAAQDAPMAVFFYGGSWEEGDRADYKFAATALARCGIVTVVPDYRVYPDVRFPDFIADGAKAIRWAHRNASEFGADPRLIFPIGHSAGAYIAAMLTLDRAWLEARYRDALAGMVGLAGPYDFLPLESANLKRIFAPAGDGPARGDLATSQPIHYARGDAAPMFLATGLDDRTVNPDNSRHLAACIRALGGSVETRFYKHANHTLVMGAFSPLLRALVPSFADTVAFVRRRCAAVRPAPGSPTFYQSSRTA